MQHCKKTEEILNQHGWPEEYIRAVVSHGWGICSDVEPQSELEKVLYAIDELTGLVVTSALVRPSKSVMDMKAKSVKKKWKNKRLPPESTAPSSRRDATCWAWSSPT